MIRWTHCSQPPAMGAAAVLAVECPNENGAHLFGCIYIYTEEGWQSSRKVTLDTTKAEFWYCLESDLMNHLHAAMTIRRNGHGVVQAGEHW